MNPLELLNEPDFWEWLGLLAVVAILLYRRVPALIGTALDRRAEAIAGELANVKRLREEAETVLITYRDQAKNAQTEAEAILSETRAETERFTAEARAQMNAQIARRARQAQDRIAQAEANAMAEIRTLAANTAVAAAAKIISARLGEEKAASLVSRGIADLQSRLS
jgi:F-type H+-transporting ATPase subunit b